MSERGHDCDHEHCCGHDASHDDGLTRRKVAKYSFYAVLTALVAAIPGSKARAGMGHCAQCNCPEYRGTQQVCANCGHSYGDHW